MNDIAIKVEHLSKRYRIGLAEERHESLGGALWSYIKSPMTNLKRLKRLAKFSGNDEEDVIWALKDINFEIKVGEVVGVIGRNGAGKSTLLKILSQIVDPTEGRAMIRGKVSSLLEVGTGFHPELSGRENIYLNGTILGMRKKEIDSKFEEIVEFSGIKKFIDTPVKRYSSGMKVRLAFSVAAHLEPEILLVDEVLAVGDLAFQKKCLGKMEDVTKAGRTILFVSHNMQAIQALCKRSILLDEGKMLSDDNTDNALKKYFNLLKEGSVDENTCIDNPVNRRGSGAVRFSKITVENDKGQPCCDFEMGSTVRFVLNYRVFERINELYVAICLRSGLSRDMITSVRHPVAASTFDVGQAGEIVIEIPEINVRPGQYPLYFWMGDRFSRSYDVVDDLTTPLQISTHLTFEELGYEPSKASGFFNIESRIL